MRLKNKLQIVWLFCLRIRQKQLYYIENYNVMVPNKHISLSKRY